MIVQIYTMQSPDEARAVAALGVNHVGVTPARRGLPGEVSFEQAREILMALPESATGVALSVEEDLDEIVAMVQAVRPDILHLCGLQGTVTPDDVRTLRARLPGQLIMQAISVGGPDAIERALAYQEVADYLILDTQAPNIAGIGASGATHDWSISAEIARRCEVPVILAGGLPPENVGEASRAGRPWGVDSLTHTNMLLPGGGFRKDMARVRAFVEAARSGGV